MKDEEIQEPEKLDLVYEYLDELERLLPCLDELSMDERCALPSLDEDREEFTKKALETGKAHPHLMPPFTDVNQLRSKLRIRRKLKGVFQRFNNLAQKLDDTILSLGSDAYVTALSIRKSAGLVRHLDDEIAKRSAELEEWFQPWEQLDKRKG